MSRSSSTPAPASTRSSSAIEIGDALEREVDHAVELRSRQCLALGRALELDDAAAPRGDDVEIDARHAVLGVAEIQRELAVNVTDAHGRHAVAKRRLFELAGAPELVERERERNEARRDRRGARPAVGFENVAIDDDTAFAELFEIERGAESAADQALDLTRATPERPFAPVARLPPLRVRAWVHLVFGGHPALAAPRHELGHRLIHRRGRKDERSASTVKR